jgi:hypothetical protein
VDDLLQSEDARRGVHDHPVLVLPRRLVNGQCLD